MKLTILLRFFNKKQLGFTFIEVILYVTLVTIIASALITFSWTIIGNGTKSRYQQDVYAQARYLSERLKQEIRNAYGINSVSPTSLNLNTATNANTYIELNSGKITIKYGIADTPVSLNSNNTTVSNLNFTNHSSPDNKTRNIQYSFTVSDAITGNASQAFSVIPITVTGSAELRTQILAVVPTLTPTPTPIVGAYYVATTGSDSNPGTITLPFRTITKGVSVLNAGNTLFIQPGTYAESFSTNIPSGTSWSAPVTIKAANSSNKPVILPPVGSARTFTFGTSGGVGQQYIILDGLILDGINAQYDVLKITYNGTDPTKAANHIRIINCEIRNGQSNGILVTGSGAQYNEFINNYIHHNGTDIQYDHGLYLSTQNNLVDGNIFANNAAFGIHLWNTDYDNVVNNNIVRNNRVYGHTNGKPGIILSRGSNNIAYNNIVYNNSMGISINYSAINTKVYNNTIYNNTGAGVYIGTTTSTTVRNNIIYSNGSTISGSATQSNNLTTDPRFVNAASNDFHVVSGSLAIDRGIALPEVTTDLDGRSRPRGSAYDIGAYEF